MSRCLLGMVLVAMTTFATGCGFYRAPVMPPAGIIYSEISAPLTTEFHNTAVGERTGTASTQYLYIPFTYNLVSFAWDDAALRKAAASDGGLQVVDYMDYKFFQVLGIYARFTVIAHGH